MPHSKDYDSTSKSNVNPSTKDEPTSKVRTDMEDNAKSTGDRYTPTGDGGHVHESYKLDKASGEYKEYSGGENSDDRSYNKDKK